MNIRVASPEDAGQILDIYAPYITNTSFTFETEVPALESFKQRMINTLENWPWLVAEDNGIIAGYAYATRYRERSAYQWCTEASLYIHNDYFRKGVGTKLYNELFNILEKQGFRNVYAVINLPNERSVALHEKLGFKHFADYEQVGYKLGKWKTVGWWRLTLNEFSMEPEAPVAFSKLM